MLTRRAALLLSTVALTASSVLAAPAPLPPNAIAQELKSFRTVGTVLHVAAHPDDENTELITYLSKGRGFRAAYLSLTRGDGGQNELGRDFDEKLGVLRTQELLAARKLDNGRQFFTRAIDFGYSKSPEETLAFWNREEVLGDVVRIYRQFRPDVVVTRFPIPPGSGGHGHHTASAMLAVEAFKLSGDPNAYPEQLAQGLTVWQPRRIYWNGFRFDPNAPLPLSGAVFKFDIQGTDPVTGESFGTIAAHSRAMHKTQGLGGFATRARNGANEQTFVLLGGDAATSDLMDGIDTTWNRIPGGAEIDALAARVIEQFDAAKPSASLPAIFEIRRKLATLPLDAVLADKRAQLDVIIQSCLGLHIEATVDRPEIVPGETVTVTTTYLLERDPGMPVGQRAPEGPTLALRPGQKVTFTSEIQSKADLQLSQPYWLREPGAAGISTVSDPRLIGLPENPPALVCTYMIDVGGERLVLRAEPFFVARDADGKEQRRRQDVVSPVSLGMNSEVFYIAPGKTKQVTVKVAAVKAGEEGILRLDVPTGWSVDRRERPFKFAEAGGTADFTFNVTAPASGGNGSIAAVATVRGRDYSHQRQELRYAHLPMQLLQPPAKVPAVSFELATRGKTIGYLPGAGDYVAECLEQMGYEVRLLTGPDLTAEKLRGLDAVVIGVRAFNERTDLKENLPGLFAYVENGGTVVTQYNRPNGLLAQPLGPYPLSIEGPAPRLRVTDERSPFSFIDPQHAAVTTPNRLGAADFAGWVQERGAYFPSKWDEAHYQQILAFNDPGEDPLKTGVLIAKHGKGHYVYTGLAFFRQLPAGVPGAYRLFANLVSLGK